MAALRGAVRRSLTWWLPLLLAACATTPRPQGGAQPWSATRASWQQRADFGFSGRVAITAGDNGFSSGMAWQQHGADTQLTLSGPLGVVARLAANGDQLHYSDRDGRDLTGEQARQALTDLLGFDLPLSSLRYWLLGVDDPGSPAGLQFDADQRPTMLQQAGWQVEYQAWTIQSPAGSSGGLAGWLPQRLVASRAPLRVKLLISRWQFGTQP